MTNFEQQTQEFIVRHRLMAPGDKVLVALSGGADSVALLRVLLSLGYEAEAVHCNFHLRGGESDRDQQFVDELCARCGVPLKIAHFDTKEYAARQRLSIEMAARELRYRLFEEERIACGADHIAVAHHLDDSAETFLLNLLRGSGIGGLRGIRPRNGHIVRPLLSCGRQQILHYLQMLGQDYVTDSSNLACDYTRNKIRLQLLPLMNEINSAATRHIIETARHLDDAHRLYRHSLQQAMQRVLADGNRMVIERLLTEEAPATLLFEWLSPQGFNTAQSEEILRSCRGDKSGVQFHSPTARLVRERGELWLLPPADEPLPPARLPERGELRYGKTCICVEHIEIAPGFRPARDRRVATIDADRAGEELLIRPIERGDRFVPFGMRGSKLVSDYLTDCKMPLPRREAQSVVTTADGTIVWLTGERSDDRFRLTAKSRRAIVLTTSEGEA